jgi:response regulator RpfG family c-di-GMP phosphodiesterase
VEHKPFEDRDVQYLDLIADLAYSTIEHFRGQQSRHEAQRAIVIGLATLAEHRDTETGRHLERVTISSPGCRTPKTRTVCRHGQCIVP